jgi:hypothetical protein
MTDLEKYLELERLEYMGLIETKRKSLEERVRQIEHENARRGTFLSGMTFQAITQAREEYQRDLTLARVALRGRFGSEEPRLLSDAALDKLQDELLRSIQIGTEAQRQDSRIRNMATGADAGPAWTDRAIEKAVSGQIALIRREIRKLRLQRGLGMETKPEGSIVLNINNSTVTGLNLGTVVGDMNATLTKLEQQGRAELAQALKALSEGIAADEQLGADRRGLLENVSVLGEQGNLPADQRRAGVVKAAYQYIAATIAIAGHSATIWATWGPQIAAFFGLRH